MIETVEIENLRGIASGKVEGLSPLSILLGVNNSGKSTILEALYLGGSPAHPRVYLRRLLTRRGWIGPSSVRYLFHAGTRNIVVSVCPILPDGLKSRVTIDFLPEPEPDLTSLPRYDRLRPPVVQLKVLQTADGERTSDFLVDADGVQGSTSDGAKELSHPFTTLLDVHALTEQGTLEDAYSAAVQAKGLDFKNYLAELTAPLWQDEPRKFRMLKEGEDVVLHAVARGDTTPVQFAGDGFRRLVHAACLLAKAKEELVLVEEPECFQHPKSLELFAQVLWRAIGAGTQVVLSTHSLEFLRLLLFAEGADVGKTSIHRTSLSNGVLSVQRIPGIEAEKRLGDFGEDLRR